MRNASMQSPYLQVPELRVDDLIACCSEKARAADYPHSQAIESNVIIYAGASVRETGLDEAARRTLQAEWIHGLNAGPGVFVVTNAYPDVSVIDRATEIFRAIIEREKTDGLAHGDHFGTNERIWNSLQKACSQDPENFIDYYGNPVLAYASEAWLGPHYQVTAQVNVVKPGGAAQSPHRDYHLGFQAPETVARFPLHAQVMSQHLTLQGAIVHSEMSVESGPTMFLPFSQRYPAGYLAYRESAFVEFFNQNRVQLPLGKGDMIFFNPALFHAAGTNTTGADRIANLIQISSAFGKPMESIDRTLMIKTLYPALQARWNQGPPEALGVEHAVAAAADAYSFPTNLDRDPALGGHAPETIAAMTLRALAEGQCPDAFAKTLSTYTNRRLPKANT